VMPRFGQFPAETLLNADLRRILAGTLCLDDRLRAKAEAYEGGSRAPTSPRLIWFDDAATDATVLEVRASDSIGLLHRVTSALEESAVDIRAARISSLGAHVVDAFYLTNSDGKPLSDEHKAEVDSALTAVLAS